MKNDNLLKFFKINGRKTILSLVFFIVLFGILYPLSLYEYSLFHTIAELITVIASIIILVLVVSVWQFIKKDYFVSMLAISLIFVAFIDVIHIFSYASLPYFSNYGDNLAAQLWIFARYLQSLTLLLIIIITAKKYKVDYIIYISVMALITTLGLASIFTGLFPVAFVENQGLTPFKIISEYIIMIVFIISFIIIVRSRQIIKESYFIVFAFFTFFQIVTEMYFTLFDNLFDLTNLLGHYFKIISMLFLTYGIMKIVLGKPNMYRFEQIKDREEKLNEIAFFDYLTTLKNRRKYELDLLELDDRKNYPITFIMIDINGLKVFNDSFGHNVGDDLIITVANAINKYTNQDTEKYRLGGDEFLIVLKNDDGFSQNIMRNINLELNGKTIMKSSVSISFGIATKNDDTLSLKDLFELSENRMYQNKASNETSRHSDNLKVILNSLFEKNKETEIHSRRVSEMTVRFGKILKLSDSFLSELKLTSLLHDIGKIGVSENILNKKGKLSSEEYEIIKTHPIIGSRIISTIRSYDNIGKIILHHHERIDGTGYPNGLKGDEIPYFSKIISICDAFDAMTSVRTYRKSFTPIEACDELKRCAGTQFDEKLVDLFIKHYDYIAKTE